MKNIVTVDFDIIMGPSIEGYNDMVGTDMPLKHLV